MENYTYSFLLQHGPSERVETLLLHLFLYFSGDIKCEGKVLKSDFLLPQFELQSVIVHINKGMIVTWVPPEGRIV